MNTLTLYPRFSADRLKEALVDTPVVLIHGPRQTGKTTLAKLVGEPLGYSYFSFDDPVLSNAAESDPVGFIDGLPDKSILDEIQKVPGLFGRDFRTSESVLRLIHKPIYQRGRTLTA